METLAHHKEVAEKYIVLMEMMQSEFAIKKKELNKKIVKLSSNSLQEQAEKTDFPSDYFDNLTKIKLEFKEIESDEKVQIDELMTNYSEEIDNHNSYDVEVSFTVEPCNDEPSDMLEETENINTITSINKSKIVKKAKKRNEKMWNISDKLCCFLGKSNGTKVGRNEVIKFISSYIKKHDLYDKHNKRIINPDDNLMSLLNGGNFTGELNLFNIQNCIKHHFKE
jgi:chromatin remodeling complex protein RSC6